MKKMMTLSLAALMSIGTLGVAAPAAAQHGYYNSGYGNHYSGNDRRYDRRDYRGNDRRDYRGRDYRGNDRRYYNNRYRDQRCDSGTGGTIIGAVAGGLAGHEIAGRGDRAVGTIIGGAIGAIAGRAIDRGNNGCR